MYNTYNTTKYPQTGCMCCLCHLHTYVRTGITVACGLTCRSTYRWGVGTAVLYTMYVHAFIICHDLNTRMLVLYGQYPVLTQCTVRSVTLTFAKRVIANILWYVCITRITQPNTIRPEILAGNVFWRIGSFESNLPIFICQKSAQCDVIIIAIWYQCVLYRHAGRHASLIVGMEFTIEGCVRVHHFSKEFCTLEVGEELTCLSTWGRQSKRRVHGRCKDWRTKNSPE